MTDGCAHFVLYNTSRKFRQFAAGQLPSGKPQGTEKAGGAKSHLRGHSPQASRVRPAL